MNKKILSVAVAAAMIVPMAAMADATMYGKMRVAITSVDNDDAGGAPSTDTFGMDDESSRLGVKGSEDLGNGLKAVYKLEFGTRAGDPLGTIGGRNAYVGLAGDWGTFVLGRHDTPLKMSTGSLDLFGDTIGDNDTGGTHLGLMVDRRVDGSILYISPSMSGFTVAGAAVTSDTVPGQKDDFSDAYSLAAMYKNGPFFGSVAYETLDEDNFGAAVTEDETQLRVGLGVLGWNNFSVTAVYEDRSDIGGTTGRDTTAWNLNAAYDFGNNRVKAGFGQLDDESAANTGDFDAFALGFQHNFSKRTDAQIIYTSTDMDAAAAVDTDKISVQLNHDF